MANSSAALAVSQERSCVRLALTVSRATNQDSRPIPRCFIASTEVNGRTISVTQGKRSTAFNVLQKTLQRMGIEPMWVAFTDLTVVAPADEPEDEPAPTIEPAFPGDEPPELDETGEHEDPAFGLVAVPPVLDKGGWLTPLSDPLAWKRCYLAAWELVTGFSVYNFHGLSPRECANLRAAIAAIMMSGDAGARVGVLARAVNPWAQGTNGERTMPWVRVLQGTPDPTTKPYRAGAGDRRDAYLTNLSGLPVNPERHESARQWRERRAARSFVGTRGSVSSVAARDARNEKRAQAHAAGLAAKQAAYEAGQDDDIAEAHYKWAYCAVLRFLGEIHAEFERQLADAGVTEEQILATVAEMKAA